MDSRIRDVTRHAPGKARLIISRRRAGQLARLGYLAIGVVYVLVGLLAVLSVVPMGGGGKVTGSAGATRTILQQPFGRVLLGIIAAGLAAYVCWRFAQAFLDIEDRGAGARDLMRRTGLFLSGLSYAILTFAVVRTLIGSGGQVQGQKSDWTAELMSAPAGAVLVGLLGAGVIAAGLAQFQKAYKAGFMTYLEVSSMSEATQRAVKWLGRFGLAARGVVFSIIGVFFVVAALQSNAQQAKGLGGALRTLREQPYGTWLIALVAAGLLAHGLHMLTKVRYRRIAPPEDMDEREAFSSARFSKDEGSA